MSAEPLEWVAFVLYLEWGLIHIMAFLMVTISAVKDDPGATFAGLYAGAPAKDLETLRAHAFPKYTNRVLIQHGYNLGIAGLWSLMMCYFVLAPVRNAFLLGLLPFLVDIGYFVAIDVPEIGTPIGEAQTYIVSAALFCTALIARDEFGVGGAELTLTLAVPCTLPVAALCNKVYHKLVHHRSGAMV